MDETSGFTPAESLLEAKARIFSLTGSQDPGTRGEKRALVALRDALELDIDIASTNVEAGRRLAGAMDLVWLPDYEERNTLTLDGVNALLRGATAKYRSGSLKRSRGSVSSVMSDLQWSGFVPAVTKIEAVNRISALTSSGPEYLGPGSKERKSVLINLAQALAPDVDTSLSKTKLASSLAARLNGPWGPDCESTGETISLAGLNALLAAAERQLGLLGATAETAFSTPDKEGSALVAALAGAWPPRKQLGGVRDVVWQGKECVLWMKDAGYESYYRLTEWPGAYWETFGKVVLNASFPAPLRQPRLQFGRTVFDYGLNQVWDLKAHTSQWFSPESRRLSSGSPDAILNQAEAMDECISDQGIGFLIASGIATEDNGEFRDWHSQLDRRSEHSRSSANSSRTRRRKSAFALKAISAFFFRDRLQFEAAKANGSVKVFNQGRQPGGQPRARKYMLSLKRAERSDLLVARLEFL